MKQILSLGQCSCALEFEEIRQIAQQELIDMMTEAPNLTCSSFWKKQ
jgi:hypothetical protein